MIQYIIICRENKCEIPCKLVVVTIDLISIARGLARRALAGVFTSHSYLNVHPPLPIRFRGSGSYGLAFAASLARFLCCLCLHSRVGEKEGKNKQERSPGLLTL